MTDPTSTSSNLCSIVRARLAVPALCLVLVATSLGCAFGEIRPGDPFDRQLTLDRAQHRYTVLVRFSDFHRARKFVAEEHRDEFMARMAELEDARFTGYESEAVELDDAKASATVRVTYTIYTPSMPYEIEVDEIQEWRRRGPTNNWRVVSHFEDLAKIAAN